MLSYEPSSVFHDAASYLSNATALTKVSNTVKLELYGLFKYLTAAPTPITPRPGIFDFAGRAKWDAWASTGQMYADRASQAEQRYLDVARDLGWEEGAGETASVEATQKSQSEVKSDDDIWDDDSQGGKKSSGGTGMGNSVSTMLLETDTDREQGSLHSLAIAGDIEGLKALVRNRPETDVNVMDEYGYTPLHLACDRGKSEVVEWLLGVGADTAIKDQDEFTALQLARIAEHDDIVAMLDKS